MRRAGAHKTTYSAFLCEIPMGPSTHVISTYIGPKWRDIGTTLRPRYYHTATGPIEYVKYAHDLQFCLDSSPAPEGIYPQPALTSTKVTMLQKKVGCTNGSMSLYDTFLGLKVVPMSLLLGLCMYYIGTWTHWVCWEELGSCCSSASRLGNKQL